MALPPAYTKKLLSGSVGSGGSESAVVPDGKTWIVRCITGLMIANAANATFFSFVVAGDVVFQWALAGGMGCNSLWHGSCAMNPGEELLLQAGTGAGGWAFRVTGYEFTNP